MVSSCIVGGCADPSACTSSSAIVCCETVRLLATEGRPGGVLILRSVGVLTTERRRIEAADLVGLPVGRAASEGRLVLVEGAAAVTEGAVESLRLGAPIACLTAVVLMGKGGAALVDGFLTLGPPSEGLAVLAALGATADGLGVTAGLPLAGALVVVLVVEAVLVTAGFGESSRMVRLAIVL